jgi:adenylate kinase
LAEILGDEGLDLAVNLEVPDEVVIERMLARGRTDDTEEAIRTRLDLYEAETAPLLERYRDDAILATVDGVGSEDEVFGRLVEVIDTHRAVGLSSGST